MESSRPGRGTRVARPHQSFPTHPQTHDAPAFLERSRVHSPAEEIARPAEAAFSAAAPGSGEESDATLIATARSGASASLDRRESDPWGDRWIRPLRTGALRDLLDAEFRRNHRFETLSSFFGDLRALLRKAVVREEETLGLERFLPSSHPREF